MTKQEQELSTNTLSQTMTYPANITSLSPMPLYELERKYILHMFNVNAGNKSRTARTLKISLKTLRNKLKAYNAAVAE